ncbi:hypothetical protein A2K22_005489, partial [Escherichia coli]|nr:hypothetical protein [Escherichia coli]
MEKSFIREKLRPNTTELTGVVFIACCASLHAENSLMPGWKNTTPGLISIAGLSRKDHLRREQTMTATEQLFFLTAEGIHTPYGLLDINKALEMLDEGCFDEPIWHGLEIVCCISEAE